MGSKNFTVNMHFFEIQDILKNIQKTFVFGYGKRVPQKIISRLI